MIVTIFSGGSGSEEIQKGLHSYGNSIKVNIIVNGYDDGKSTGIVRKIYNNSILGPSDLRKNQLIKHRLKYGETELYLFLIHRFTSSNPKEYVLNKLEMISDKINKKILYDTIISFFNNSNSMSYSYEDFNIGNIIYSQLMSTNNNIMHTILGIDNEVYYQCNKPLRLKAITENNIILENEEDIVNFNNNSDKIKDVYFINDNNKLDEPGLEVVDIINKSDIIIFSCGTQWSSLIPTYKSKNFYNTIKNAKAKKYLICNLNNDSDMINSTLSDYFNLYTKYLPTEQIKFILPNKPYNMNILKHYSYLLLNNIVNNTKHNGTALVKQIFMDYFRPYMNYNHIIFDYDYTIYDKDNIKLSELIIKEINNLDIKKSLLSANDYKNIKLDLLNIDCEIITNHGCYDYKLSKFINNDYLLSEKDIHNITYNITHNSCSYENRLTSIAFKPTDRDNYIKNFGLKEYRVIKTGKTTVEIMKHNVSKTNGYKYIYNKYNDSILYLSDEDDVDISMNKLICNQEYLLILLKTLNSRKEYLNDLVIVAGGLNSRMNINKPKLLMTINGKTVLDNIIENAQNYVRNIYVLTNNIYYDCYDKSKYNVIKCYGYKTIIPNGNLETLLYFKNNITSSDNIIVIWGDCIPMNEGSFAELQYKDNDFLIPAMLENNPYAYIQGRNNIVDSIIFRRDKPTEYGLHDMSIFCLKLSLLKYIEKDGELHLFDIIPFVKTEYFETKFKTTSFNTMEEFNLIENN
jgi:2-phospho-L-lactate transferase/gluconeogenesis factor (CofD/UPF0052 family)